MGTFSWVERLRRRPIIKMSNRSRAATTAAILFLVGIQTSLAKIEVISTTCQVRAANGEVDWMTCPIKGGQRETPTSFRQFKDDLNSSPSDQKYCCGDIDTRFCCSLDEKLKELPDFDPIRDDDDGHQTSYHSSWYDHLGFW